jgi:hypothetical protein
MSAQSISSSNSYSSAFMASSHSLPLSVDLAQNIVRDIASSLLAAMARDLAKETARKIKNGTFTDDDYTIVKACCSTPVYRKFKRDMSLLETVREGEQIAAAVSDAKRVSKQAKHKDADYLEAVAEHAALCHPQGGFLAGSRMHSRPAQDVAVATDSNADRGIKRRRLVRNEED